MTESTGHYPAREYWRPIPGYAGYAVSNHGRVVSAIRDGQIIKPWQRNGYLSVQLGAGKPILYVHRLVCEAFHGSAPTPAYEVAHWDGNQTNNLASNLRWATKSENALDSVRHQVHYWARQTHCVNSHAFADHAYVNKRGHRQCRACGRAADARRRARLKAL